MRARAVLASIVTVAAVTAAGITPSPAEPGPAATTSVADVRGVAMSSGGPALLTYEVTHDVHRDIAPFTALPGARIPRSDAFDGLWGDGGYAGAWLSPAGSFRFQFQPETWMVESSYFTNWTRQAPESETMPAGDRWELAMGNLSWDAPLPGERTRATADGRLTWDAAVDTRVVDAKHGALTGQMDAVFIRADIVARGGDVDARGGAVRVPPITFDLPRSYPTQAQGMYIVSTVFPYTHYVTNMDMRVLPAAGKAVLTANARGYIPEAREVLLPGGQRQREWHIPLHAVVLLSEADDLVPRASMGLPSGAEALVGEVGGAAERVRVAAGGTLTAGVGAPIEITRDGPAPGEAVPAATPELEEFAAASTVDHRLSGPVDLSAGAGEYAVTVDPDLRGEDVLAMRSLVRRPTEAPFAETFSVPYLIVDGETVPLDRSRLVDLRVFPSYKWVTIGLTGSGAQTPLVKTRTLWGSATNPGLVLDAVYDLGGDRYAFLESTAGPNPSAPPSLGTYVYVISFGLTPVQARPVWHLELPGGPVSLDGEEHDAEFAAPLDLVNEGHNEYLHVGGRQYTASVLRAGFEGRLSVLRSPAPLSPTPQPDPSRPLGGAPVTLVYTAPEDLPASWNRYVGYTGIQILDQGPPPSPDPKPIGTPCGPAQVTDPALPDAPPALDIQSAWLDADDANLYATLRLREAPAPPQSGTYRWSLHWRRGPSGRYARASLSSSGAWSFDEGGYNGAFFKTGDATGETSGALIRMTVPLARIGYLHGNLLTDTGAHSWLDTGQTSRSIDQAPDGADPTWGTGGAYRVGHCPA